MNSILDIIVSFRTHQDVEMGYTIEMPRSMKMALLKHSGYTWMKDSKRGDVLHCVAEGEGALTEDIPTWVRNAGQLQRMGPEVSKEDTHYRLVGEQAAVAGESHSFPSVIVFLIFLLSFLLFNRS